MCVCAPTKASPNKYAVLDESTSACSSEVEDELYGTCAKIGITLFTVSHREYLKRHHNKVLTFVGEQGEKRAPFALSCGV